MQAPVHSAMGAATSELAWELLRDEWDLLLAVGSGPTSVVDAAGALGEDPTGVEPRLERLCQHGLVVAEPALRGQYRLAPRVHTRQESMSSYLRDLVLRRLEFGGPAPLGGVTRDGLADGARLLAAASEGLLPRIVALASRPESAQSERFLACFAVAQEAPAPASAREEFPAGFLRVLKAAAVERCHPKLSAGAKVWVAEMRVDPEVAQAIAEELERFVGGWPGRGGYAATTVILPSGGRSEERGKKP